MIDRHSETWIDVESMLKKQREKSTRITVSHSVDERIADYNRGMLGMIDMIKKLDLEAEQ